MAVEAVTDVPRDHVVLDGPALGIRGVPIDVESVAAIGDGRGGCAVGPDEVEVDDIAVAVVHAADIAGHLQAVGPVAAEDVGA